MKQLVFFILLLLSQIVSANSISYPDLSEGATAGMDQSIVIKGLPGIPGNVRLLFQAMNISPGNTLELSVASDTESPLKNVAIIPVAGTFKSFGGPERAGNRNGVFTAIIPDTLWNDNVLAPKTGTIMIKRVGTGTVPFRIRWPLLQPERIGMAASKIAMSPRGTHRGGLYWFGNIPDALDEKMEASETRTPLWALRQDFIDGVCLTLWWKDVQRDGPHDADHFRKSPQGLYVERVLTEAARADKNVHLYIRGLNNYYPAGAGADLKKGVPEWVFRKWTEEYKNKTLAIGDSLWLESHDNKTMADRTALVVTNAAGTALYQVIHAVYGADDRVGMISAPSFCQGEDPGQFGWRAMKDADINAYLDQAGFPSLKDFVKWYIPAVKAFIAPHLAAIAASRNPRRAAIISSTILNYSWKGYAQRWSDDFYRALLAPGGVRDPKIVFASYHMDAHYNPAKQIAWVLTSNQYADTLPTGHVRQLWQMRAATQDGGIPWLEASDEFLPERKGKFTKDDFDTYRTGLYNAFNLGGRSIEIWRKHFIWLETKTGEAFPSKADFYGEAEYIRSLFSLRNTLAEECNLANFPGQKIW